MTALFFRHARVVTLDATPPDLGVLPDADVRIADGVITHVGPTETLPTPNDEDRVIDAAGRVLMPAFVDCHTHACWAGDRLDEWEAKLKGATYLELLAAGGGIMATVRAVRSTPQEILTDLLVERLDAMLRHGTTRAEVKSGYGLSTEAELKMLRAIAAAAERWPGVVYPTACIGHALDPDVEPTAFVRGTIEETLPAVSDEFPGITIDAYCEKGAWSLADCERLFASAQKRGHPIRVHADQFNSLGMVDVAVANRYVSVDHLEATSDTELDKLGRSSVFGVMLPCSGFHVDGRYGKGRRLLDAGGRLALATNYNPGSAPCPAVPMALALGVRHLGITPAEAILAGTRTAAKVVDAGLSVTLAPGNQADVLLLRHRDERQLAYEFGGNPVEMVVCQGEVVRTPLED